MATKVMDEYKDGKGAREWQCRQVELCSSMMRAIQAQVSCRYVSMGHERPTEADCGTAYPTFDGQSPNQLKDDIRKLRRELLNLAKSYGWKYGK